MLGIFELKKWSQVNNKHVYEACETPCKSFKRFSSNVEDKTRWTMVGMHIQDGDKKNYNHEVN